MFNDPTSSGIIFVSGLLIGTVAGALLHRGHTRRRRAENEIRAFLRAHDACVTVVRHFGRHGLISSVSCVLVTTRSVALHGTGIGYWPEDILLGYEHTGGPFGGFEALKGTRNQQLAISCPVFSNLAVGTQLHILRKVAQRLMRLKTIYPDLPQLVEKPETPPLALLPPPPRHTRPTLVVDNTATAHGGYHAA